MIRFWLALQFLTRLPTPPTPGFKPQLLRESARWFPMVGLVVGAVLALLLGGASALHPALAGWLALLAWVWITGGLHLDGLADLADGLGAAHRDPARLLAVMKDPHLGSFGVLALLMQCSGKGVLLFLLAGQQQWLALCLIPAWARLGPLYWQSLPPLAAGGEAFAWQLQPWARRLWLWMLLGVSVWVCPALLLAPGWMLLWRQWLLKKLGGVSGDCLGAGIEVLELALLLSVVLFGALVPPGWCVWLWQELFRF